MSTFNYMTIDREAIRNNFKRLHAMAPGSTAYAVVKADAYGLGAVKVAQHLEQAADGFCVATPQEGIELREAGISKPIICLGYTPEAMLEVFLQMGIQPTVYDIDFAKAYDRLCASSGRIGSIQIKLDTGHSRLGFLHDAPDTIDRIEAVAKLEHLNVSGLFSHFTSADEADESHTMAQIDAFDRVVSTLRGRGVALGVCHLANDAGVIAYGDRIRFEGCRLGISIYGEYPSAYIKRLGRIDLEPVFSWACTISHLKLIEPGTAVGYGRTWTAKRPTRLATLTAGYADGYMRALSNSGSVLINGRRCPVVGRVCMDQMMVDVTDAGEVCVGDEAILIGRDARTNESISVDDISALCDTISYEVLTRIGGRVSRVYE